MAHTGKVKRMVIDDFFRIGIILLAMMVVSDSFSIFPMARYTRPTFSRTSSHGMIHHESSNNYQLTSLSSTPSGGDMTSQNEGDGADNYDDERIDKKKSNSRILSSNLMDALASATQSSCSILGLKSIGVDYGLVRTGIAVTVGYNPEPLVILSDLNVTETCEQVVQICKSEQAKQIIVGLPLHKNGTEANQTRITRAFADDLARHTIQILGPNIPVYLWDERYTSKEAAARAHSRDPSRQLWGQLDAEAACIILENYYHDSGVDAERVELDDDVKQRLQGLWEQRRLEEEAKAKVVLDEREARMERRRMEILRDRQLEIENNNRNTGGSKKKKKQKKKRQKRGPWIVPGANTTSSNL